MNRVLVMQMQMYVSRCNRWFSVRKT